MQVDHIHMVMIILPKYAVSDAVNKLKEMMASRLRKKVSWLSKVYQKENVIWLPGYFLTTVIINETKTLEYVQW